MSRPQEYLSFKIIFPTIGSNSTKKAVRFAPYFPLKSLHTPGGGMGDTIDNCITQWFSYTKDFLNGEEYVYEVIHYPGTEKYNYW